MNPSNGHSWVIHDGSTIREHRDPPKQSEFRLIAIGEQIRVASFCEIGQDHPPAAPFSQTPIPRKVDVNEHRL